MSARALLQFNLHRYVVFVPLINQQFKNLGTQLRVRIEMSVNCSLENLLTFNFYLCPHSEEMFAMITN